MGGRHSLVTPIDWKLRELDLLPCLMQRRHSLVTPIDWKPLSIEDLVVVGHQVAILW